ncbi:MAG: hypothetical protein K9G38_02950 [Bacteroidales bacterium]|nr:hypothetical protein [Bacteroidales bacterium]
MSIIQYSLSPGEVKIQPQTVFRLMHMDEQPVPEPYRGIVEEEVARVSQYHDICGGYCVTEHMLLNQSSASIEAEGETFFAGKRVVKDLTGAEKAAMFICTAGSSISGRIKMLFETGDHIKGYVADIIGSVLAEEAMNVIQQRISDTFFQQGLKITNRYSPGYCEWDVQEQHKLFRFFPDNFCGVTLTENALMTPAKSVSGIIGIGRNVKYRNNTCHACTSKNCIYRNRKEERNYD